MTGWHRGSWGRADLHPQHPVVAGGDILLEELPHKGGVVVAIAAEGGHEDPRLGPAHARQLMGQDEGVAREDRPLGGGRGIHDAGGSAPGRRRGHQGEVFDGMHRPVQIHLHGKDHLGAGPVGKAQIRAPIKGRVGLQIAVAPVPEGHLAGAAQGPQAGLPAARLTRADAGLHLGPVRWYRASAGIVRAGLISKELPHPPQPVLAGQLATPVRIGALLAAKDREGGLGVVAPRRVSQPAARGVHMAGHAAHRALAVHQLGVVPALWVLQRGALVAIGAGAS